MLVESHFRVQIDAKVFRFLHTLKNTCTQKQSFIVIVTGFIYHPRFHSLRLFIVYCKKIIFTPGLVVDLYFVIFVYCCLFSK